MVFISVGVTLGNVHLMGRKPVDQKSANPVSLPVNALFNLQELEVAYFVTESPADP